jgi:uncharacterized protein (DUF1501 family)
MRVRRKPLWDKSATCRSADRGVGGRSRGGKSRPGGVRPGPVWSPRLGEERGDVSGWVLIMAMMVALVMLVWGVASEALRDIITGFLNQVRFD